MNKIDQELRLNQVFASINMVLAEAHFHFSLNISMIDSIIHSHDRCNGLVIELDLSN